MLQGRVAEGGRKGGKQQIGLECGGSSSTKSALLTFAHGEQEVQKGCGGGGGGKEDHKHS